MNTLEASSAGTPKPYTWSRSLLHSVVASQAIVLAIYGICTARLLIRARMAAPKAMEEITARFLPYAVGESALILVGYVVIGLALGSFTWLMLWCLSSTLGRRMTPRLVAWGAPIVVLAILLLKTVSSAVYTPRILENVCRTDFGIRLIGATGDLVRPWMLMAVQAAGLTVMCLLVVAGVARSFRRLERPVRLTLIALAAVLPILIGGLGLIGVLERLPAEPRNDGRPNILILATDGLRPDHLGAYGYERPTSPNIDRLSQEAVRFQNVYVPQARTLPSLTTIMTGTYPHTHGQRYTWPRERHIDLTLPTLCRELKKKGYRSYVMSDWAGGDFAKVDFGFDVVEVGEEAWNIRTWIQQEACRGHPLLVAFGDNPLGFGLYPGMRGMPVTPTPQSVTQAAVSHLEDAAREREPFFMVVFYSETHLPFSTPYPYYRMFSQPGYKGPHKLSVNIDSYERVASAGVDAQTFFDPVQVTALYDGAIRSFDDQAGEILASVKELNLWDDTMVIVMTDHGEDLLETGDRSWGHGRFLFGDDYDNRIPLIISDPQLRGKPRVINEMTSTLDIMPTLLDRVGLPVPSACEGESQLGLIRGQRSERPREVFAENSVLLAGDMETKGSQYMSYPPLVDMLEVTEPDSGQVGIKREYLDLLITARQRMIRTPEWKLLYTPLKDQDGASYELYDLKVDPQCLHDVQNQHPDVLRDLKARLWQWMEQDPMRCRQGEHMVRKSAVTS
ncbi:MAG: sulfatase-like hydrolase/transferase [Planctomycetes bacterium]|nr:sulfatase-like hydrolase/transferase [Planctomycetota bacterium]